MTVNYDFKITAEDNTKILDSRGDIPLNIEKFKEIEKICFEWGYSTTDLITFFIENLTLESAEELLSTMQYCK